MPSRVAMGELVSADVGSTPGPLGGTEGYRKGPHRAEPRLTPTEKQDIEAAPIFDAAAAAYGAEALATELDVDASHLSKMRRGQKSVPLRALIPILRDPVAALALLAAMCRIAGFAPPRPIQKVTRRQVEEAIARKTRQCVVLWRQMAREAADELGTSFDDVEAAMVEPA
jgi:hypothetical protein